MGAFGKMFFTGLAVIVIAILIGFIYWITGDICPKVLSNLSTDPQATEILGGICKSISSTASNIPNP
jgi:hypothetical protein